MTSLEQEARIAAECLTNSFNPNQYNQSSLDMSHSHSINTIPSIRDYLISEDLLAGQRVNGRMSNVRRFFCLFVTFDFLFTSLMWIICVMLNGEYILKALTEQVIHYNIHKSLFDIVLVAFCRFFILLLFYALLYINHWIIISLSTAITCCFLLTKVFFYDWPNSQQPIFEVLLVLTSFVLAWGEAWFLDFRVIPQEFNADRYLITATDSERTPLIRNYIQNLPSAYTESIANYFSTQVSPEGSLQRFDQTPAPYPRVKFTREEEEKYFCLAANTLQTAWDLFKNEDWTLEKEQDKDFVFSRIDTKEETIFKLEAEINASPRYILEELFCKVQHLHEWNSAVKESYKIQVLNEYTDITYQISEDVAGGLVKSRDFVNLRHWGQVENCFVIVSVKTEHPSTPITKKFVRGENGIGCFVLQPVEGEPNKCKFYWIFNIKLNLSKFVVIPKNIFNKEMIKMMFKFASDLRKQVVK